MDTVTADRSVNLRALIDLSSEIARRGYGEPVVELALYRKGVPREIARLVAASAIGCRRAILAAQESGEAARPPVNAARPISQADLRAARAANRALWKIANFLVLVVAGFGLGALAGWSIGFGHGVEDGFDWIVRVIERLIAG
ncbi:MAG: hypothetical protein HY322_07820 [Betaproteobacteria bacterium]|nr:hypothetical protein [Betaproteobacteria bacterium]